jgi:hypothetical protein
VAAARIGDGGQERLVEDVADAEGAGAEASSVAVAALLALLPALAFAEGGGKPGEECLLIGCG